MECKGCRSVAGVVVFGRFPAGWRRSRQWVIGGCRRLAVRRLPLASLVPSRFYFHNTLISSYLKFNPDFENPPNSVNMAQLRHARPPSLSHLAHRAALRFIPTPSLIPPCRHLPPPPAPSKNQKFPIELGRLCHHTLPPLILRVPRGLRPRPLVFCFFSLTDG